MRDEHPTPLGALGRGLVAGLAGTAAMTAYQMAVDRTRSAMSDSSGADEKPMRNWGDAPAPARVAPRVLKGVFKVDVPLEKAPLLEHGMHWVYGTAWGGVYGLMQGTFRAPAAAHGLGFGALVWGAAYALMTPMGIYKEPWKYPPQELGIDLSYHLVYGLAVAEAYDAVD